ncbi:MAG: PAS domain-containing protein [Fulvivirga sp.]
MNYLKKELYQLIKEDDSLFEFIQNSATDGMWYWDIENPEEEWMNRRFWEVLGYDPEKMPHKASAWQHIINEKDLAVAIDNFQKHCINPDHLYDQVVRYAHKEGHTVYIRCKGLAIRNSDGKPIRMLGTHSDITEFKKNELLLEQSSRLSKIGYWEYDLGTDRILWSKVTREIHEVEVDYQPGLETGINFYTEHSREIISKAVDTAINKGEAYKRELEIITAKGNHKWVIAKGQPEFKDGKCVRLYGTFQDITDRKTIELKLKVSEEQFRGAFDYSAIGMAIVSTEGHWLNVNKKLCTMLGYSKEELMGKTFQDITHPDDLDLDLSYLNQMLSHEIDTYQMEKRYYHKTGNIVWVLLSVSMVSDRDNNPIHFVSQIENITKRKKAEDTLKEVSHRYTFATSAANIGIWDWNLLTNDLVWDDQMYKIFNIKEADFSGAFDAWRESVHPKDLEQAEKELELAFAGKKEFDTEFRIIWPNKSVRHIRGAGSVQRDESGKPIRMVGANWDITREKKAAKLEAQITTLKSKSKEMEQFAYITSHDLREPLNTIKNYMELFQEDYQDQLDDIGKQYTGSVIKASKRMELLIMDLLNYSRLSRPTSFDKVDCNLLINEIIEDLNAIIEQTRAEIKFNNLPTVSAQSTKLRMLFQNLIQNAIKFKGDKPPIVEISAEKVESGWQFCVTDNGIGIAAKDKEKIFVIFRKAHKAGAYNGTGIGLANAKKIVEIHNGNIWVESTSGEGSSFKFTLITE